jgi:hypothetical protein
LDCECPRYVLPLWQVRPFVASYGIDKFRSILLQARSFHLLLLCCPSRLMDRLPTKRSPFPEGCSLRLSRSSQLTCFSSLFRLAGLASPSTSDDVSTLVTPFRFGVSTSSHRPSFSGKAYYSHSASGKSTLSKRVSLSVGPSLLCPVFIPSFEEFAKTSRLSLAEADLFCPLFPTLPLRPPSRRQNRVYSHPSRLSRPFFGYFQIFSETI